MGEDLTHLKILPINFYFGVRFRFIFRYFQEVLSSGRLSLDGNEIQLHSDGSWSSLVIKKEQSRVIDQGDAAVRNFRFLL